ncbi:unnamed protein product [Trifolium pratense]|uniref:Uncharacterized protein n=1 Tax=Trifolium pratense TaxID=57577 RepID=A0ACB0JM20_TRIPR|nr:unnamed protein product [Trifolium pratense]
MEVGCVYVNLLDFYKHPIQYKIGRKIMLGYQWSWVASARFVWIERVGLVFSSSRLKSVIYHFRDNSEFPRLRIGIGKPPGQMDPKAFLLQKFNVTARQRIDEALHEGIDALKLLLSKGLEVSAKRFNKEQKYKHLRVQTLPVW